MKDFLGLESSLFKLRAIAASAKDQTSVWSHSPPPQGLGDLRPLICSFFHFQSFIFHC